MIIFNPQQLVAIKLMQNDLRFLYTVVMNHKNIHSNYIVSAMPYIGVIIDGVEDWVKVYNNSHKIKINIPTFTDEEKVFYEELRSSIKIWNSTYDEVYKRLEKLYRESDDYFSSVCKPVAKILELYDIFGVDIVDGQYCGNTILGSFFVPGILFGDPNGEHRKQMFAIGGRYTSLFGVIEPYEIKRSMRFSYADYGGFVKSPVGNAFSDKFVLFSILCQVNFILKCVDEYLSDETTTKLRFAYLLYYYVIKLLPEINERLLTNFYMNGKWVCDPFRNAMAHYKIGVALKESEIIFDDPFYGLTQKFFGCDYVTVKNAIIGNLLALSYQLRTFLRI